MTLSNFEKEKIKERIVEKLRSEKEIMKIVIFGSFLTDDEPNDIDLAVFQTSKDNYLSLALKYRKAIRDISKKIPIDVLPLTAKKTNDFIFNVLENGEVIFERGN
jgi:predicted nucleotidyltransferase